MKHPLALALGTAVLLLAACQKEKPSWLEITLEAYNNNHKVVVDGATATWDASETIRINSGTADIVRQANGHTYIAADAIGAPIRALYPASLTGDALGSNSQTIDLPAVYHYRSSGGHQVLDLPMAAYSASIDGPLHFMHLTGALYFTVTNTTGGQLTLDSLVVVSDSYSLSGSRSIDFAALGATGPVDAATAADRRVALVFDREALVLDANASCTLMVPVAPVGDGNHFSVRATGHRQGTRYTFAHTQTDGGTLVRNQLGYAAMSIASTPTYRLFSGQGRENIPYLIGSAYEWKLMAEAINQDWSDKTSLHYNQAYYTLTTDIDLGGASVDPIAKYSTGTFGGGNHRVGNLTGGSTTTALGNYSGLFVEISGSATVKNLVVDGITLRHSTGGSDDLYMGGLAATVKAATITNCHVRNIALQLSGSGKLYYGAIAGQATVTPTIDHCRAMGTTAIDHPSSQLYYGGIVGIVEVIGSSTTAKITACRANHDPQSIGGDGTKTVGGIVGQTSASCSLEVKNCHWQRTLDITSATDQPIYAGGMIGIYLSDQSPKLSYDTVDGTLTASTSGTATVGAYVGSATYNNIITSNCIKSGAAAALPDKGN